MKKEHTAVYFCLPTLSDNFLFYRVSVSVVTLMQVRVSVRFCSLAPPDKLRLVLKWAKWAHSSQLKCELGSLREFSVSIVGIIEDDDMKATLLWIDCCTVLIATTCVTAATKPMMMMTAKVNCKSAKPCSGNWVKSIKKKRRNANLSNGRHMLKQQQQQ